MRGLRPVNRPAASPPPSSNANGPAHASVRLLVRVYSGEELSHSSSQGAYCKLYLGDAPMLDGSGSGRKSFEKRGSDELLAGATSPRLSGGEDLLGGGGRDSVGGDAEVDGVRVFRTKVQHQQPNKLAPPETIWNESFEVPMPAGEAPAILSVRVKSHHLLYCPVIGACAISLLSLRVGERLDQFFPLHRGKKSAGRLRLMLQLVADDGKRRHNQGSKGNMNNNNNAAHPDILAARAANREADDAIKRLLERRVQEDEQRRQRKLERRESRREEQRQNTHPAEVGPPVFEMRTNKWEDASPLAARKLDDVVHSGPKKKAAPASEPAVLPPLGAPAGGNQQEEQLHHQLKNQLQLHREQPAARPQDQDEREKRLDRKLRRLQRERARLQRLKQQLKKYIPDLNTDSDSDSGLESDASSTLSSGSERPRKSTP